MYTYHHFVPFHVKKYLKQVSQSASLFSPTSLVTRSPLYHKRNSPSSNVLVVKTALPVIEEIHNLHEINYASLNIVDMMLQVYLYVI